MIATSSQQYCAGGAGRLLDLAVLALYADSLKRSEFVEIATAIKQRYRDLAKELDQLSQQLLGGKVAHIYNPLSYARAAWEQYLDAFCPRQAGSVLFLGMNPGPDGMAQTGVPFGAVPQVQGYLGISGGVTVPAKQHPRRPILGFQSHRTEPSGKRLWNFIAELFPDASKLPEHLFILNHCPLLFLNEKGSNIAMPQIPKKQREAIVESCDKALAVAIKLLKPRVLVGIGVWAEEVLHRVRAGLGTSQTILRLAHPSPASPSANRGWNELARPVFQDLGLA